MSTSIFWNENDARIGLCTVEQVGQEVLLVEPQLKFVVVEPDPVEDEADWSIPVWQRELKAYRANPERYRATSPSSLNKLLDVEARQLDREAAALVARPVKPPSECTLAELETRLYNTLGLQDDGSLRPLDAVEWAPHTAAEVIEKVEKAVWLLAGYAKRADTPRAQRLAGELVRWLKTADG